MQTLDWKELEPSARGAFNIWMSGSDFEWAQEAWTLLTKAGFCSYDIEYERHIVIGRYLALASIYRDWCSVACDETQEDVPEYWVEDLEVWPIYLGQLVSDEQLSDDPEEAVSEAWTIVMNGQREQTIRALQQAYGGQVEDLFVAFWRSVRGLTEPEPDDNDYVEEDDASILNTPTESSLAGYGWVRDGCPNMRP